MRYTSLSVIFVQGPGTGNITRLLCGLFFLASGLLSLFPGNAMGGAPLKTGADSTAAQGQPCLEVVADNPSIGPVIEGALVPFTFVLRNTGRAPLLLKQLNPGKGTRIVRAPKSIAQGKEGRIELALSTLGKRGKTQRGVRLLSNDPDCPVKYLPVTLMVTPQIDAVPDRFSLSGMAGGKFEGKIELKGNLKEPLELKIAETQLSDTDTVRLEKVSSRDYTLLFSSSPGTAGITRGKIVLSTSYPQYPRFTIPVMVRTLAPLQALPGTLEARQGRAESGIKKTAGDASPFKAHCLVRSNDHKKFTITQITSTPGTKGLTTRITPVTPGALYRIDVDITLGNRLPRDTVVPAPVLEIHTDHPDQPVLKVPVKIKP